MLHSIFRKVGKERKLKITKVGSNIAFNITSRLCTRPKASPPPSYWAEHILYSALHKDITFSHLFLSTFFLVPFCSVFLSIYSILKSQYTGAVVPLAMFELCSSSFKCICITIFSHIFPFNIWYIVFSNSCIYFA